MTEAEWLDCTDPTSMWELVRGKASERKLYLFGCACCRRIWHILTEERCRRAVEIGERFLDGQATNDEREAAALEADKAFWEVEQGRPADTHVLSAWDAYHMGIAAATAAQDMVYRDDEDETIVETDFGYQPAKAESYYGTLTNPPTPRDSQGRKIIWDGFFATERAAQCGVLRDVLGNPFRPVSLDSAWLTSKIVAVTQAIYDERAYDRLPVLADALEVAGCHNADILNHCRQPGMHVHGCWVVDALLGKE